MFREFLAERFPGDGIEQLSGSNNLVYLVRTKDGPIVAKHVTDTDIPLTYLVEANEALAAHLPVQNIVRVFEKDRGDPFDAVFAEYVEGRDLATVLAEEPPGVPTVDLVEYLCRFVMACRDMPRTHNRFGMFKRDAPAFDTHREFVEYYGNRYWGRVRPFYESVPVADAVDAWLAEGLARVLKDNPAPPTVVPVDANLKNFVVTPDRRIVVLNVPIAAVSTPAHAVAAISMHLRNRDHHRRFLDEVRRSTPIPDPDMVPHFELWMLIGILSFYAVRQPERQKEWRDWGAPVPLHDDFTGLVETQLIRAGGQ